MFHVPAGAEFLDNVIVISDCTFCFLVVQMDLNDKDVPEEVLPVVIIGKNYTQLHTNPLTV